MEKVTGTMTAVGDEVGGTRMSTRTLVSPDLRQGSQDFSVWDLSFQITLVSFCSPVFKSSSLDHNRHVFRVWFA